MNQIVQQYTALIVDDEKLARANISYALSELENWHVVAECSRGDEVLEHVKKYKPQVVFLDIKMPGLNGLVVCQLLQKLERPPVIIFVTAFDAHAIEAFELCALDYLLKPFDDFRFSKTIKRAVGQITDQISQKIQVNQLEKITQGSKREISTLIVRSVGKIQLIRVDDINWLSTAGNYIELHLDTQVILHRVSLSYLEKHLSQNEFCRIHRTAMVRTSQISEFLTLAESQYAVVLKNGDKINVSLRYKQKLLDLLGIE